MVFYFHSFTASKAFENYLHDYFVRRGYHDTAKIFAREAEPDVMAVIADDDGVSASETGLLFDWWCAMQLVHDKQRRQTSSLSGDAQNRTGAIKSEPSYAKHMRKTSSNPAVELFVSPELLQLNNGVSANILQGMTAKVESAISIPPKWNSPWDGPNPWGNLSSDHSPSQVIVHRPRDTMQAFPEPIRAKESQMPFEDGGSVMYPFSQDLLIKAPAHENQTSLCSPPSQRLSRGRGRGRGRGGSTAALRRKKASVSSEVSGTDGGFGGVLSESMDNAPLRPQPKRRRSTVSSRGRNEATSKSHGRSSSNVVHSLPAHTEMDLLQLEPLSSALSGECADVSSYTTSANSGPLRSMPSADAYVASHLPEGELPEDFFGLLRRWDSGRPSVQPQAQRANVLSEPSSATEPLSSISDKRPHCSPIAATPWEPPLLSLPHIKEDNDRWMQQQWIDPCRAISTGAVVPSQPENMRHFTETRWTSFASSHNQVYTGRDLGNRDVHGYNASDVPQNSIHRPVERGTWSRPAEERISYFPNDFRYLNVDMERHETPNCAFDGIFDPHAQARSDHQLSQCIDEIVRSGHSAEVEQNREVADSSGDRRADYATFGGAVFAQGRVAPRHAPHSQGAPAPDTSSRSIPAHCVGIFQGAGQVQGPTSAKQEQPSRTLRFNSSIDYQSTDGRPHPFTLTSSPMAEDSQDSVLCCSSGSNSRVNASSGATFPPLCTHDGRPHPSPDFAEKVQRSRHAQMEALEQMSALYGMRSMGSSSAQEGNQGGNSGSNNGNGGGSSDKHSGSPVYHAGAVRAHRSCPSSV